MHNLRMDSHETAILAFEGFELDTARSELRRSGAVVAVEPQVFDLIVHFARHPGQMVSRDDLIDAVWGGRIVSESAISTRINAARTALGDDGTTQRIIKTIPRRGFRFEATLHAPNATTAPLPDKPSIAVLPFQNMSEDPDQTYFSDGITDDIITDLSRYSELFVIARHSSFAYRDSTASPADIARELGVQYIAEGSVRRAGNRIRVTARLVDPLAGNELWAERYDRDLTDIFEVQDEITEVIVNTLVGHIARQHYRRSLVKSPETVNAYDRMLRALELVVSFDPASVRLAIAEAQAALALDPNLARAHAIISWAHIFLATNGYCDDPQAEFASSGDAALAAVATDDKEPYAHATLGWVYQWRDRNISRAFAELDRAVSLNPGSAHYRSLRAFSMTYAGRCEEALAVLREGMRLNPHFPVAYHIFSGRALFHLHRYPQAMIHLEKVRAAQPDHPNALALVAACYAANGQLKDAKATTLEIQKTNPKFTLAFARRMVPYVLDEDRALFLEMLQRAGLPE